MSYQKVDHNQTSTPNVSLKGIYIESRTCKIRPFISNPLQKVHIQYIVTETDKFYAYAHKGLSHHTKLVCKTKAALILNRSAHIWGGGGDVNTF
jgi:hypothetical protein